MATATTTTRPRVTTTTRPRVTTTAAPAGTYSYSSADRDGLLSYCASWESDCEAMVNDATRVGTTRTCSPVQIRNWMDQVSLYGYPYSRGINLTTIETACGPIYG